MATEHLGAAPSVANDLVRLQDIWGYSDAWQTYTPTWTQGATISNTVNYASYIQIGKMVVVSVSLAATSTGTATTAVTVSLPVTAVSSNQKSPGSFALLDTSASTRYAGSVMFSTTSTVVFTAGGSATGLLGATGGVFTAAIASGDTIDFTAVYETAAGFGGLAFPPAGGWQTYTPTLVQSGAVTKTVTEASYTQIGRLVVARVVLAATGAGTSSNAIVVGLPVAAATSNGGATGSFSFLDQSTGNIYAGSASPLTTTTVQLIANDDTGPLGATGSIFTGALASGDTIALTVTYEAATTGGIPAPMGWTAYTPTLVQSGSVTNTANYAKYVQTGKTVRVQLFLSCTGTGTGSNDVRVGVPVPGKAAGLSMSVGSGYLYDISANLQYRCIVIFDPTNSYVTMQPTNSTTPGNLGSNSFTAALASADQIVLEFSYEAA